MAGRHGAVENMVNKDFWKGKKRVFLTGHTGFKGSWMCRVLLLLGADITGYSLDAPTTPNLYSMAGLDGNVRSIIGDIRDFDKLRQSVEIASPDIVIHMAAQPIVRESYSAPRYTYETNVMGTVNILESIRLLNKEQICVLNITTDKVYKNNEWCWGYRETDALDGYDPYSNSKSCSELVTDSYKNSFFHDGSGVAVSTARAGNVIGGGDFASDRIIPDCVRAALKNEPIIVRNPNSTRPYQHVLEPLTAYLTILEKQYQNPQKYSGSYNIGPDECDCVTTGELAEIFCQEWGEGLRWKNLGTCGPHEANFLKLDCSKAKSVLGWRPKWHIRDAVRNTCEWTKEWQNGGDVVGIMDSQINEYFYEN